MKQDMIVILDLGSTENTKTGPGTSERWGCTVRFIPHDITASEPEGTSQC